MPVASELTSVASLYTYLGIGAGEAKFLGAHARFRYISVSIPKRRGGVRILRIPEDRLKYIQRKLLPLLEKLFVPRIPVHGFVKDRSAITNANAHQARPFLLKIDLEDYFGGITRRRVRGVLEATGIPLDVAKVISNLTVVNNNLPQGAPTSPLLANMVTFRLDRELMEFAKINRVRYTRYADDITFSSYVPPTGLFSEAVPESGLIGIDLLSPELRLIFASNDFKINTDKLRYAGRLARKEVTGLVVNEFTNVRRDFIRNLRAALYQAEQEATETTPTHAGHQDGNRQKLLRGRLEWLAQVRGRSFSAYRTLAARYNALFPNNLAPIDPTYEDLAKEAIFILEYHHEEKSVQGTAFFLEGVGLVTAHHNLSGMPVDWADLFHPHNPTVKYQARFGVICSQHHDVAVLENNVPEDQKWYLKPTTTVDRIKTPIIALGYPEWNPGETLNQRPGHIVGRSTKSLVKMVEVSANLGDGLSGGPVVNERYEVLGVIHKGGALEQKQLAIDVSEVIELKTSLSVSTKNMSAEA